MSWWNPLSWKGKKGENPREEMIARNIELCIMGNAGASPESARVISQDIISRHKDKLRGLM